jgi:hypothetical protein
METDGKLTPLEKFWRSGIFTLPGQEISKDALIALIAEMKVCDLGKAGKQVVPLLISDGFAEEFEKPRPRARPEIWLRRTDKQRNCTSFASVRHPLPKLVTNGLEMAPAGVCLCDLL